MRNILPHKGISTAGSFAFLLFGLASHAADSNFVIWGGGSVTNVPIFPTNAIAVTGGDTHGMALLADRTVRTWGSFAFGGAITPPTDATNVVSIASGSSHALAVRNDGTIAAWGRFFGGSSISIPVEATNVVAVGVGPGAQHGLALRADGTVVDWGAAYTTNIPPEAMHLVSVAAGATHSLALRSDGRVVAWGNNWNGATNVPSNATNIVAVATTWEGCIALRADGRLLTWGMSPNIPNQATLSDVLDIGGSGGFFTGGMALRQNGIVAAPGAPAMATNIMAIGGSGSTYLAVKAAGPPIFPLLPVGRTVAASRPAYFRLRAVGALPMSYQWQYYGTNLPGATNAVLAFTNAQPGYAGPYVLTVSNALGVATSGVMPLAVEPLEVTIRPKYLTALGGSNATFTAVPVGQGPFSYQWQFKGENLPGATSVSLLRTNVTLAQAGNYSVIASNTLGARTSHLAFLTVLPLSIAGQPQSRTIVAGADTTFTVMPSGSPPFSYQWRYGGNDLPGMNADSLTLTNVQPAQAGLYSVVISNDLGSVSSANATLTVLPLAIGIQPTNVTTLLGADAAFYVTPVGVSPFTYQWRFQGENLAGATNSPLILTNARLSQVGSYSVMVSNQYGTTSSVPATLSLSQVAIWGDTASGQTKFPPGLTNVIAISAGYYHTVALRDNGTVVAWSSYDQTNIPPQVTNVIAIASGGFHNLALRADGTVTSWGSGYYDSTAVPTGLSNVVAISGGEYHSLALRADGTVVAWGAGSTNSGIWPDLGQAIVPEQLSNVVAIACGGTHSLALKSDGTVVAWGLQTNVPATVTNVLFIDAGYKHNLALKDDGTPVIWGENLFGQTNMPPSLTNVVLVEAGNWNGAVLTSDGKVIVWERNDFGQTNVPVLPAPITQLAGGNFHYAALLEENPPMYQAPLLNPQVQSNRFSLNIPTRSGRVYALEYTTSLSSPQWMSLPLVAGTGKAVTLADPNLTGVTRFYRVCRW
jgi:alpha-tubulin suppressor-like RCC1 family protein